MTVSGSAAVDLVLPLSLVLLGALTLAMMAGRRRTRTGGVAVGALPILAIYLVLPLRGGCLHSLPGPCSVSGRVYSTSWLSNDGVGIDPDGHHVFLLLVATAVVVGATTLVAGIAARRRDPVAGGASTDVAVGR